MKGIPVSAFIFFSLFFQLTFAEAAARGSPCFSNQNSTQIRRAVQNSVIIFTGKIVELSPLPPLTFKSRPAESAVEGSYYYYNFTRTKRRIPRGQHGLPSPQGPYENQVKDGGWAAKVKVKTLFKGKTNAKVVEGEMVEVLIGEWGNGPCPVRRLRLLDTRVFFYAYKDKENGGERGSGLVQNLEETLMPLPPTLFVLTTVRDAVKGTFPSSRLSSHLPKETGITTPDNKKK